jgi:hypothetical protein
VSASEYSPTFPKYVELLRSSIKREPDKLVMTMLLAGSPPMPATSGATIATTVWYFFLADHADHARSYLALADVDPTTGLWSYYLTNSPNAGQSGSVLINGATTGSKIVMTVPVSDLSRIRSRLDWSDGANQLHGTHTGGTTCPAGSGSVVSSNISIPKIGAQPERALLRWRRSSMRRRSSLRHSNAGRSLAARMLLDH